LSILEAVSLNTSPIPTDMKPNADLNALNPAEREEKGMKVSNIPTRFALIKRAEKILRNIDDFFEDADSYGLTVADVDPDGLMQHIRADIIAMLQREGRLKNDAG
jgi:hypothetical protein